MNIQGIYTTTQKELWKDNTAEGLVKKEIPVNQEGKAISFLKASLPEREVTWEGFGGCFNELGKMELDKLPEEKRNEIYDRLFSPAAEEGLRLNFLRIPIGASDYAKDWYSLNEHPGDYEMEHFSLKRDRELLIPYIKEAVKRNQDLTFFASPWSPPAWMKSPAVYNFGHLVWTEENLKAYALYLLKFVQEYEKEGIPIHQLHVQNEVTSDQKFPSCVWTGAQLAEFIRNYLGPLFEKENCKADIWLGTINGNPQGRWYESSRYTDFAGQVLADDRALSYIKGVAYQWEGKRALQATVDSYPELKYIQSESECGEGRNDWEYAKYVFELLRHYIRNGVCAYVYWNMILAKGGISTWGWRQNSMITVQDTGDGPEVTYEYEYYIMKHLSRYVSPGAKVMKLSGHFSGTSVAFQGTDGKIILIIQNPHSTEKTVSFEGAEFILEPDSINTVILSE